MNEDEGFAPCSIYWSCTRCGALVARDDRERHRAWHRSTTPTTTDQERPR